MKTQICTYHDVLSCDNICNYLCTGACGGLLDLVLIPGDAMEADNIHLLAHYLLPFLYIIGHHHHHHHHHHLRLYSPGWALVSSSTCHQRPLSWSSACQFLQSSFPASSSTPSVHLNFGWPCSWSTSRVCPQYLSR
jgi:hypothetical protein